MANEKQETLIVLGRPVVQLPDGSGSLQLEPGELSAEHAEQLGANKIASLRHGGYLQTQEQIDEAERLRTSPLKADKFDPNPNFGTPSMTPEAAEQASPGGPDSDLAKQVAAASGGTVGTGRTGSPPATWQQTKLADLGLSQHAVGSLEAAGLKTAGDVAKYGEANDGLTSISGVGEATEQEIKAALKKAAR